MTEACRLCLESPLEFFEDMAVYLKEINFILPEVDVNLTEGPIICLRCSELLLSAYSFKCNCLKIEEELREKINQAVAAEEESNIQDIIKNEDEKTMFDEFCDGQVKCEEAVVEIQCTEQTDETFDIAISPENKTFLCTICNEEVKDNCNRNVHLKKHTGLKYNCEICCSGFPFRSQLTLHKKQNHPAPQSPVHKVSVALHKKRKHPALQCDICDRKFLYKAVLVRHMIEHRSGPKKYFECNICGIKKRLKLQLAEHMRVHTGERPYTCSVCSKSFTQAGTLSTHIRTMHLPERPFVCEICGKAFAVRAQCTSHMRSHGINAEKKFICNFCGRAYMIHSKLEQHIRRHTGEKLMVCHVCSKRFVDKSDLNRHFLIHTGEKRYECPICHRKFGRKGNMEVHLKSCRKRHSSNVLVEN